MRARATVTAVLLLSVAGCVTSYPPLVSIDYALPATPVQVDYALKAAAGQQKIYGQYYRTAGREADLAELPLIGLATAAAILLFANATVNAKAIGYLGIGAGAYVAGRGVIAPRSLTGLYLQGYNALSCIRDEGPLFSGPGVATEAAFDAKRVELQTTLAEAELAYAWIPKDDPGNTLATHYQNAKTRLDGAISAARPILSLAYQEAAAKRADGQVFASAVTAVSMKVATRGREGRTVDYAALVTSLAPAKVAAAGNPEAGDKPTLTGQINAMNEYATQLNQESAELKLNTPAYAAALERVGKCPALVGG